MRDIGFNQDDYWLITQNSSAIQRIDLGDVDAGMSVVQSFSIKYRGFEPAVLIGFHLGEMPALFYSGSQNERADVLDILDWAANGSGGATITHESGAGVPISNLVSYGFGDSAQNPIPYQGSVNGIFGRGDEFEITIEIAVPVGVNEIPAGANRYNVALFMVWREISPLLLGDREEQGDC